MQEAKEFYTTDDLRRWPAVAGELDPPARLAVVGDPVAHSASPPMHDAALAAAGIRSRYVRLHILPDQLEEALRLLPKNNFIGTNVTIPHKFEAMRLMDEVDEYAQKIGAVNTVLVEGDRLIGFNTDGPGFVRAIRHEWSVDVRDMRVMILGAGGGAGRGIAVQCAMESCERLALVNRTVEKARELAAELAPYFRSDRLAGPVDRLVTLPWDLGQIGEELRHTDLVVNTTPIGMRRVDPAVLPGSVLLPHLLVYDTVYTAGRTKLLMAAEEAGARAAAGLSMLLFQGALSFEIWFNRTAPVTEMREALRKTIDNRQ